MSRQTPSRPELDTAWWARSSSGGVRRVWVEKRGDSYHCAVKITTAEQEAALQRLCGLDYEATAEGSPSEAALVSDAQLLAGLEARELDTADPLEAWRFLGGDDAARNALIEADPSLEARSLRD